MATPYLSLAVGLTAWEIVGRYFVTNKLFFVPFTAVLAAALRWVADGTLWPHLAVSAGEFAIGFALAAVVAIGLGLLIGTSPAAHRLLDPWITALYSTPLVALAPYFIIIFGIYLAPKVALVFVVSLFPILINTFVGVRSTDAAYLEVARSFSTPRIQVLYKILVPGALPFIVSGLRLGVGRGLTAVVVGEIFVPNAGIGYLISVAAQTFNTADLFAGVLVFALAGVLLTAILERMESTLAPWRPIEGRP
ncbi:MAG TPA: ABC transporter permease [Candidatus Limnocylindria bacterium]|nr:ABC transporter permease [Candidatus Limnocylindria bacterium]